MYFRDALNSWGKYLGSQNKPKDFDEFWEVGKKEVRDLGLEYELIPHEIYSKVAEGFDLFFMGIGGAKIHCQLIRPKHRENKLPVQLQFHGYHTNSGDWGDKIALAAEGFLVVAMDVRGQGGLSEDVTQTKGMTLKGHIIRGMEEGPKNLFFRSVFLDIYQLTQIVFSFPEVDVKRVSAYGASQGGAQAIVCGALEPKVANIFCLYPFLSDYREAYRLNVLESAYEELAYWFRFKDPQHVREDFFFNTLDYIDIQYLASKIKGTVIWGMGLADTVCHPKTQFATFNQITAPKELMAYPEYGHEYIPGFGEIIRQRLMEGENYEEISR